MERKNYDVAKIIAWAVPQHWPYCCKHEEELALLDSAKLSELESIEVQIENSFNKENLAQHLLRKNIQHLYRISGATRQFDNESLESAAGQFLGKFGDTCTVYAMMCYFANYNIEYKQTLKDYDLSDILRQYRDKFVPHWNKLVERRYETRPDDEITKTDGLANLKAMIWGRLDRGESPYTLDEDGKRVGLDAHYPIPYAKLWEGAIREWNERNKAF